MVKANGKNTNFLMPIKTPFHLTNMTDHMSLTAKMDMEFSHGRVGTITKAIMLMMKDMATEKCTGLMAQFTEDSGKTEFRPESASWCFLMMSKRLGTLLKTSIQDR